MPNDDLISKSELKKTFAEYCPGDCSSCDYSSATDGKLFCALIEDSPVIDAEPTRYGTWIKKIGCCKCSECLTECWADSVLGYDYCPNCGAKMENPT